MFPQPGSCPVPRALREPGDGGVGHLPLLHQASVYQHYHHQRQGPGDGGALLQMIVAAPDHLPLLHQAPDHQHHHHQRQGPRDGGALLQMIVAAQDHPLYVIV